MTFHAAKSVHLDAQTLRLAGLNMRTKTAFLASKARAIARMARSTSSRVDVAGLPFEVRTAFDLGTLQSSLIDVAEMVHGPGILTGVEHPVVIDVGANIGQFMAAIKAFHPTASVLSIEPDPDSHAQLLGNVGVRSEVTAVAAAAGAAPGTLTLHRHELSVMSTLRPGDAAGYDAARQTRVPVETLDSLAEGLGTIDLLKIDVEGFELDVLEGAAAVLARTRFVLIEIGLGRDSSEDNLRVLTLLQVAAPQARIVRFGRPLGTTHDPVCQDVLVQLRD